MSILLASTCCCDDSDPQAQGCCLPDNTCESLTTEDCEIAGGTVTGPCQQNDPDQCLVCSDCIGCPETFTITCTNIGSGGGCPCLIDDFERTTPMNNVFCNGIQSPLGDWPVSGKNCPPTTFIHNISISRLGAQRLDFISFHDLQQGGSSRSCLNHPCLDGTYTVNVFNNCNSAGGQTGTMVIQ